MTAAMLDFSSAEELNAARAITRKSDLPQTSPEDKEKAEALMIGLKEKAKEALDAHNKKGETLLTN